MFNTKGNVPRLAIAIKLIFIAQLFAIHHAYGDNNIKAIQLEMPNAAWWNKAASSQHPKDIHFNVADNLSGLKTLAQVRERMMKAASQPIHIAIQKSGIVNAYARQESGHNLIIFTTGFIKQFGNDADVLANTLGHEIAHHNLGHIESKSEIVSLVSNESVGALNNKSVQANELAADKAGIEYAIQAGYSACGGYRLFAYLNKSHPQSHDMNHSSHPIISERLDLANKLNMRAQKGQCS